MPRNSKFANPFYSLLLIAGVVFALTATAYGVMAFREARSKEARPAEPQAAAAELANAKNGEHPLMLWMRRRGELALLSELALLAVFTFAAIGTDSYWQRHATAARNPNK